MLGVFGLEHDRPPALDGALVVRLRRFGVAGEEASLTHGSDGLHRFRRLVDLGEALGAVVGKGLVQQLLKGFPLGTASSTAPLFLRLRHKVSFWTSKRIWS